MARFNEFKPDIVILCTGAVVLFIVRRKEVRQKRQRQQTQQQNLKTHIPLAQKAARP